MKRALILSGGGPRGAFQVGVCQYLAEKKWDPDLICGTSVGSINAVALGAGMPMEKLARIWTTHRTGRVFRPRLFRFLWSLLFKRPFQPLADAAHMRDLIHRHLDLRALRRSRKEIVITAVNMLSSRPRFFDQDEIGVDHVMASCAMPGMFPWQMIDGVPYWDGGMLANTPLLPALARGAEEIVVVLLSPAGHLPIPLPQNAAAIGELALEHFMSASYQNTRFLLEQRQLSPVQPSAGQPRIMVVSPSRMPGLLSLIHFSTRQARRLIREGFQCAQTQLQDLCTSDSGNHIL